MVSLGLSLALLGHFWLPLDLSWASLGLSRAALGLPSAALGPPLLGPWGKEATREQQSVPRDTPEAKEKEDRSNKVATTFFAKLLLSSFSAFPSAGARKKGRG